MLLLQCLGPWGQDLSFLVGISSAEDSILIYLSSSRSGREVVLNTLDSPASGSRVSLLTHLSFSWGVSEEEWPCLGCLPVDTVTGSGGGGILGGLPCPLVCAGAASQVTLDGKAS